MPVNFSEYTHNLGKDILCRFKSEIASDPAILSAPTMNEKFMTPKGRFPR